MVKLEDPLKILIVPNPQTVIVVGVVDIINVCVKSCLRPYVQLLDATWLQLMENQNAAPTENMLLVAQIIYLATVFSMIVTVKNVAILVSMFVLLIYVMNQAISYH